MKIKNISLFIPALAALLLPSVALALPTVSVPGLSNNSLIGSIMSLINAFLIFISILAVIFIIIGGIKYIISQGDEKAAVAAKNTVLYAIIGLIVIGLAAAIVNFVVSAI